MILRRLLHTFPEAPELAARNIVHGAPVIDPRGTGKPHFQTMGLGSVLEVQLPSSVELVAKRNSLVGILGTGAGTASLTSRLQLARAPLASVLGRQPLLQQTIVGASPLTCLISAGNKYMNSVELDGSLDWVVRSPLMAHTGQQLHVRPQRGLSLRAPAPFPHTVVSGRGLVAWATPASPVQIVVPEGDSVLVDKRHLSAFTIDTNAAFRSAALTKMEFEFKAPDIPDLQERPPATTFYERAKNWTLDALQAVRTKLGWLARVGNTGQFVEVFGPSTVLVSAAAKPPPRPQKQAV